MSLASVRSKVRGMLNEGSKKGQDIRTFNTSKVFTLSEQNVISITSVFKNGSEVPSSGNWSYSSSTNKLTFDSGYSLIASDIIEINYNYYPNYSDDELDGYITGSLMHISMSYDTFEIDGDDINPEPSEAEKNLIALIASIIIRPDNKSYRLPDLTITVPIAAMPTDDMIRKVITNFKKDTHGVFSLVDGDCNLNKNKNNYCS